MGLGIRDRVFAAPNVPFAPGRDDGEIGRKGGVGQLEPNLIIPLAGARVYLVDENRATIASSLVGPPGTPSTPVGVSPGWASSIRSNDPSGPTA